MERLDPQVFHLQMNTAIREFGRTQMGANDVLRPGGYAVIVDEAGAVAIVKTPSGFMLPGGGQESGESPELAVLREAREECGLTIALDRCLGVADELVFAIDERTHYRKRCTFFLATLVEYGGECEPDHDLHWFPSADAACALVHESQRWAVAQAGAQLRMRGTP